MQLNEKIQNERKKKGLSQEELANSLNVSRQAVQKWESGASQPEIDKLVQISDLLDVSLDYLLKKDVVVSTNNETAKPESAQTVVKHTVFQENGMLPSRIKACKIWLIIGAILTPMATGGAYMNNSYRPEAFFFLFLYAITIPLCCCSISAIKKAKDKNDVIGWGIVSLIFVSLIGGILILSAKFQTKENTVINIEDNANTHYNQASEIDINETNYQKMKVLESEYGINGKINDLEEIVKISSYLKTVPYKDSDDFYNKYDSLLKKERECRKEKSNKTWKKVFVSAAIVGLLAAIIVPTSIAISSSQKQAFYDSAYNNVTKLLSDYDDSNYNCIWNSISDLYGSNYDTEKLRKELESKHQYCLLLNDIANYESENNNTISSRINSVISGYEKINQIKQDFETLKNYQSTMNSNGSQSANSYASDESAQTNRNAISYIYKNANTSGLWNFNSYTNHFSVPYLVCGASFSYSSYNFKWYKDSSGEYLTWSMPTPSSYDSSKTYYLYTSFSGSGISYTSKNRLANQLTFKLKTKKSSSYNDWAYLDLFRIDKVSYSKNSNQFSCEVYLFGTGRTATFIQN